MTETQVLNTITVNNSQSGKITNVFVKTFGCQMNVYDSEKMFDVINQAGKAVTVLNPEEADIILINTCSVREKAQEKLFSELGRYYKLKKKNPNMIIGVGGCVASQEGKNILKRAPYVDIIFGPQTLHLIPKLIKQRMLEGKAAVDISFPENEKFDHIPTPKTNNATAYVTIIEGCNKYCSYCVVPYTRGEEISRPFDDVITEIAALSAQGVVEITLLGQNVNDYHGAMHDGNIADLATLIRYTAAFDSIQRIRFTTSHPTALTDRLVQAYAEEEKLVNHLHLPVQSGSDRILAAMKRDYSVIQYKSLIRKIRKIRPNISISSDFIVGFPGETDKDFMETMKLVREVGFDHSYSFIYSERPGTPAASLLDDVPMEVKKQRLEDLQNLIQKQAQEISHSMVGTIQKVLISGASKRRPTTHMSGRTENNRVVNIPGAAEIGKIYDVKITEVMPNSLFGEFVIDLV